MNDATVKIGADIRQLEAAVARAHRLLGSLGQGSGAQASARAANAMAAAARATGNYSQSLQAANNNQQQMAQAAGASTSALDTLTGAANRSYTAMIALSAAVGGVVYAFMKSSDAASEMTARLAVAYESQAQLAIAMKDVAAIATETRSGMVETASLYGKMALSAQKLGLTQNDVASITGTFAKTLKVSGASATEASAAMLQFSQAMASGQLSGDELRSLLETNSYFMKVLTDATGKTSAELKKMGAEGELTAAKLSGILLDPANIEKVNAAFARIPVTFSDIGTAASNSAITIAQSFASGFGIEGGLRKVYDSVAAFGARTAPFFQNLGKIISGTFASLGPFVIPIFEAIGGAAKLLADNIGVVSQALKTLIVAVIAFKAANLAGAMISAVSGAIALQRALGGVGLAQGAMAAASVAAQRGIAGVAMAARGALAAFGPWGIAIAVISAGLYLFMTRTREATAAERAAELQTIRTGAALDYEIKMTELLNAAKGKERAATLAAMQASRARAAQSLQTAKALIVEAKASLALAQAKLQKDVLTATQSPRGAGGGTDPAMIAIDRKDRITSGLQAKINTAEELYAKGMGMLDGLDAAIAAAAAPVALPPAAASPDGSGSSSGASRTNAKEDFWKKLEDEKKLQTALLGIGDLALENERERLSKVQEYEDIVKRTILPAESERLNLLLAQTRAAALTVAENERFRTSSLDSANELAKMNLAASGLRGRELAEQEAILDLKNEYLAAGTSIDALQEEQRKKLIEQRTQEAAINYEIDRRKRAMEDIARIRANTPQGQMKSATERYEDGLAQLAIERRAGGIDKKEFDATKTGLYNETIGEVKSRMLSEWGSAITDLGNQIGGKFGKAVSTIGNVIDQWAEIAKGGFGDGLLGSVSKVLSLIDGMENPLDLISDYSGKTADLLEKGIPDLLDAIRGREEAITVEGTRTKGFQESFRDSFGKATKAIWNGGKAGEEGLKTLGQSLKGIFGKGGDFMQGLGAMLGQAQAGAQTGTMVDGVLKGLGINSSKTGAQIGGAIGSFVPIPGGAFIGAALGGIVGGMLKKKPYGTAGFALEDGQVTVGKVAGNKAKDREASRELAQSVAGGINDIAKRLGASVTSAPGVTIGTYKGDYRVSESGYTGKLKVKNGAVDFGKDADAAIAFAIKSALSKGILDGISDFSKRVIKTAQDMDSAVSMAEGYEKVLKDLANLENPLKAAFDGVSTDLNKMIEMMKKAGATSEELGNVERYRVLKLKEVLDDKLSPFRDIQDQISRASKSPLAALQDDLLKFNVMRGDIAAGRNVDGDAFNSLAQRILSGNAAVNGGNTAQATEISAMVLTATTEAMASITKEYDATVSAIHLNTQATDITNDLLRQVLQEVRNGNSDSGNTFFNSMMGGTGAASDGGRNAALDIMTVRQFPSVNGANGGPLL